MQNTDDRTIELSPAQSDPFLARPEDFTVMRPDEAANMKVPGHGQCGDSYAEYQRLLRDPRRADNRSKPTGKGVSLPVEPDQASAPHTKLGHMS